MPDNHTLRNTLYETRDTLRRLRSNIFTRGHMRTMHEIDTLIEQTEEEIAKVLSMLSRDATRVLPTDQRHGAYNSVN